MEIGIKGKQTFTVTEDKLASKVGSGLVAVFATPMMIAAIENTAAASVAPYLEEGKTTVGTLVNVTHVAATPLGMTVRIETELTDIAANGKILTFRVAAYDEVGLIGEGTHQRAVVDRTRFEAKAAAKKGG
ncbi:MAG: thioesterase family protein [Agathobaculum sp.]|uniref:thioesterase family protein n=1 Tax=Agathobaculum sp. TaxID=2048138 RepID=UPI002A841734|nr:thioesterase family protein [Agathobaculum sp.]MDY3711044.1 thioesterase family protein [Agathobaculum sp.]